MTIPCPQDFLRAARLAGAMVLAAALLAAGVRVVAPVAMRSWLDLPFGGIPAHLNEVVSILVNNARLLLAIFAVCGVAQLGLRNEGTGLRALTGACDALVIAASAYHVAFVGATVGAYGEKALGALLPHGPIELAAYSLALSLYVSSRRELLGLRRALAIAALSAAGLVVSAFVEVMT